MFLSLSGRQPSLIVPDPDDPELHHLLRHDDIPVPALAVPAFPAAAADGPDVLPLGLVLGAAVFVPVTLMEWKSSGPDSGPPVRELLLVFFLRWAADPLTAIFPVAGLVTAGLYWWLGTWRHNRVSPDYAP